MSSSQDLNSESIYFLAKEVSSRVQQSGNSLVDLTQLSCRLLCELRIPLDKPSQEEFVRAFPAMVGMSAEEVTSHIVEQLTPEKSPALYATLFGVQNID